MIRERPPAPIAGRVDARRPVTPALVAAVAGVDGELASRCLDVWCDVVSSRCGDGAVLVFDDLVVGPNEPVLLEGWHSVQRAARAEDHGVFDELEEAWYDDHFERCGGDCDHAYERPTVAEWALFDLRRGWCGERFVDGRRLVARHIGFEADRVMEVVRAELAIERLMTELADAITVDGFPVVDARSLERRRDRLRWAA